MLTSAKNIIDILGIDDDEIYKTDGTGPWGAPENKRWICSRDVFKYAFENKKNTFTRCFQINKEAYLKKMFSKTLWDYQESAVKSVINYEKYVSSGIIEMDCGTGKTFVGCELIRLSGTPSMVITPHVISSKQWVKSLNEYAHLNVYHIHDIGKSWKKNTEQFPDVLVCTYASITKAFKTIKEKNFENDDTIIWLYIIKKFGILILDEVHLVAADQFRLSCQLNCSSVIGFSGSLIREDEKLYHLNDLVGPVLFTHLSGKKVRYGKMCVTFENSFDVKNRSKEDYALRTLNPQKMSAVKQIISDPKYFMNRIIIFSDSAISVEYIPLSLVFLEETLSGRILCGALNGKTKESKRIEILERFYNTDNSILLASSVCNVAVNFPDDCIVVQLHNSSGSRCQEMQRCGRSGRGECEIMTIIHILNENTEEEKFYNHRSEHMKKHYRNTFEEFDIKWTRQQEESDYYPSETYEKTLGKKGRKKSKCFQPHKKIYNFKKKENNKNVGVRKKTV